jgi:hypothetical protein
LIVTAAPLASDPDVEANSEVTTTCGY